MDRLVVLLISGVWSGPHVKEQQEMSQMWQEGVVGREALVIISSCFTINLV